LCGPIILPVRSADAKPDRAHVANAAPVVEAAVKAAQFSLARFK
jgi:hypothetical protein